MARHMLSAIISYRKDKPICIDVFPAASQHLVWYSTHVSSFFFEAEQAHHYLSLPPLDSVLCLNGQGPDLTPERED